MNRCIMTESDAEQATHDDFITAVVDQLMRNDQREALDKFLYAAAKIDCPVDYALGLLTASLPMRSLPSRSDLVYLVTRKAGDRAQSLLQGLR